MGADAAPGWVPWGFGEKRVDQAEIEAIEDGAVVQEGVAQAALGMAGELAVVEREVGRVDGDVRDGDRIGEHTQQQCVAAGDVTQFGTRIEGKDQGDIEAAGAEDDRAAAGVAAKERDVAGSTGVWVGPGAGGTVAGEDDGGMRRFPDEEVFLEVAGCRAGLEIRASDAGVNAGAPRGRRPWRVRAIDARQNLQLLVDSPGGRERAEIGKCMGAGGTIRAINGD